jgi:hypothetical protein
MVGNQLEMWAARYFVVRNLRKGEKMSKTVVFILLILLVVVAGFLAYTQTMMLL